MRTGTINQPVLPVSAGASEVWSQVVSIPGGGKGLITKARFMPATNVTADASDNADLSIEKNGSEIASEVTTSGDLGSLTAGTEVDMALVTTATTLEISDGDLLTFKKTHANSGVLIDGTITLDIEYYRGA